MQIYDTVLKQKVKLVPLNGNDINIYVCGPTVYDDAHLDIEEVLKVFKSAKPFLDYINRAIEFSREEVL